MNVKKLDELVAEYALEHPERELSRVTLVEFALWYQQRVEKERKR